MASRIIVGYFFLLFLNISIANLQISLVFQIIQMNTISILSCIFSNLYTSPDQLFVPLISRHPKVYPMMANKIFNR